MAPYFFLMSISYTNRIRRVFAFTKKIHEILFHDKWAYTKDSRGKTKTETVTQDRDSRGKTKTETVTQDQDSRGKTKTKTETVTQDQDSRGKTKTETVTQDQVVQAHLWFRVIFW